MGRNAKEEKKGPHFLFDDMVEAGAEVRAYFNV